MVELVYIEGEKANKNQREGNSSIDQMEIKYFLHPSFTHKRDQ